MKQNKKLKILIITCVILLLVWIAIIVPFLINRQAERFPDHSDITIWDGILTLLRISLPLIILVILINIFYMIINLKKLKSKNLKGEKS